MRIQDKANQAQISRGRKYDWANKKLYTVLIKVQSELQPPLIGPYLVLNLTFLKKNYQSTICLQDMATSSENKDESDKSDYQTPVICDQCVGHKNVNSYCLDCKANICDTCKTNRIHREHKLLPKTHPKVTQARHQEHRQCKEHPGNQYVTFCNKCNIPCCTVCISTHHHQHSFSDIAKAANDARWDLRFYLANLEKISLPTCESVHKDLVESMTEYNNSMEEVTVKSRRRFKSLRDQLDCAEQEWMRALKDIKIQDLQEVEMVTKQTENKMDRTKNLISVCKMNLADASDIALLLFNSERPDEFSLKSEKVPMSLEIVQFEPSDYKLPPAQELIGKVKHRNKRSNTPQKLRSTEKGKQQSEQLDTSINRVMFVKTLENICCISMVHAGMNKIWVNNRKERSIQVIDENFATVSTFDTGFYVVDLAMTSPTEVLATDRLGKRVLRISDSGNVTQVCNTVPLSPRAICVNNRNQVIVGVSDDTEETNVKMVIFSRDGSTVLREIQNDTSGKPIFSSPLMQIKQKRDGDYVVSYGDTVKCVNEEGTCKWNYCVRELFRCDVYGLVCDANDNIIIAETHNNKISLLGSDGKLIRTLLTEKDGIKLPWSLCLDKLGRLWMGQNETVKIVTYMK